MKKIILMAVMALGSLAASAQVYVGGEAGLWRNADNNDTHFTLRPEVGYELNEKWDLGLSVGYSHDYDGKKHKSYTKINAAEVNPYARWTFAQWGPVNLFLEMGFGFETYKVKAGDNKDDEVESDAHNAWNVGVKPGLSIDVAKHLQFITHVGFLGYRDSDDDFNGHKHDGFGFHVQSDNLTVGLLYKF